jgi:hypothetical protein
MPMGSQHRIDARAGGNVVAGGAGETTSALALAFVFTRAGAATMLIDAAPTRR